MAEEFDSYAIKYDALLSDPLREGFADTEFFHVRKPQPNGKTTIQSCVARRRVRPG
jgi:hypothetical protein